MLAIKLISTVNGLSISRPLGKGLQLGTGFVLVNDKERISKFVSPDLKRMMGSIEYNHLINTACAFCGEVEFDAVSNELQVQYFLAQ